MLANLLVDLNPVWDQIIYTPVHSLKETLLLEVMDYQNLTKDRSLGTVELRVSELAREIVNGAGDSRFSFESSGKMDKSEPIRLDRGNQYKGQLHYVAEFLPAFALQDLKFETSSDELPSAVEGVEDGDDVDDDSSSSSSKRQVLTRVTTTEPMSMTKDNSKNPQPENTMHAAASTEVKKTVSTREGSPPTQVDGRNGVKQKNEGMHMSKDELLAHRRW
jgi:Ca2+-dependent lipid-binding protein